MNITNISTVNGNNLTVTMSPNEIIADLSPDIAVHQSIYSAGTLLKRFGYLKNTIKCSEQQLKLSQLNKITTLLGVDELIFKAKPLTLSLINFGYAKTKINNIVFTKVDGLWTVKYIVENPLVTAKHIADICSALMVFNTILLKWYLPDAFFSTDITVEFKNLLTTTVIGVEQHTFAQKELVFTPVLNRNHFIVGTSTPKFLNREFSIGDVTE